MTRAILIVALSACGAPNGITLPAHPAPTRPSDCVTVPAGPGLQARVNETPDRGALCLEPGRHGGPLRLSRGITIWGPRAAVINGAPDGTTVVVDGAGGALLGVTVDGSGARYDRLDAGVLVRADGARVEGIAVVNAVYGILVERARNVQLRGNEVMGQADVAMGLRGDAIRLWETTDSVVEGNRVTAGRDVVVWYSSRNRIIGNRVEHGRYGTHLMYSHDCVVEGNQWIDDSVGLFVMYSHDVTVKGNVVDRAGIGIGLKDSGNVTASANLLLRAQTGLYLDTAPVQIDHHNHFVDNTLRMNDTAVVLHARTERNHFRGNSFADNLAQVRLDGNASSTGAEWDGNHYDDYAGYDLDDDGKGDVAYELRSLSGELTGRYPSVGFLRGTPALGMADAAARMVPLFDAPPILVDRAPLMRPRR